MRRTRFMTWFFVVLSLAFFCVGDFRVALEAPLVALLPDVWTGDFGAAAVARKAGEWFAEWKRSAWRFHLLDWGTARILERLYTLERYVTPQQLRRLAYEAEQRGDSQFMAFAALHLPQDEMREDVLHLTDRAVEMDPKLTWVICFVVSRYAGDWGSEPFATSLRARADTLQKWDPDNAIPHVLRAGLIRAAREKNWTGVGTDHSKILKVLAQDLEWQKEMEAAFTQPRYDTYELRRFELERKVMLQRGWDHPVVTAMVFSGRMIPRLIDLRDYAKLAVENIGSDAEAQGEMDKALRNYRLVARFGERVQLQHQSLIYDLLGIAIQRIAYERLVPALRKAGMEAEAAEVDYAFQQRKKDLEVQFVNPLSRTSNHAWSVLQVNLSAGLTWVFLILTLACLLYVNIGLRIRREKKGRLYEFVTVGENYFPVLLFMACLGLYLGYMPYARNLSFYMMTTEPFSSLDGLLEHSFPFLAGFRPGVLPLENPFYPYAVFALAGLVLLVGVSLLAHWRGARKLAPSKGKPV
jgi:hypothetical protein